MASSAAVVHDSLIDTLRRARSRLAVVKTKFVSLKGASGNRPIFAFEGDDDKIVYGRWIARITNTLKYEVFVCGGKKEVAELKLMLDRDLGGLGKSVYYFVDRDFVDLDGFGAVADDTIYMTPSYSFENMLVTSDVLDAVLRDEFPLHGSPLLRAKIVSLFEDRYREFLFITGGFNWQLYLARRLPIALIAKPPARLNSYANVELHGVGASRVDVTDQVQMSRRPTVEEERSLYASFASLHPQTRYRGKNALIFFTKWLSLLAQECGDRATDLFDGADVGPVRHAELTIGGLASKAQMPEDFQDFINRIAA
jgi:hypothetical protein